MALPASARELTDDEWRLVDAAVAPSPTMPRSSTAEPPSPGAARKRLLENLARRIPESTDDSCVLVGIDGRDGAGKTVFADELAATIRAHGRPAVRISVDDFHHVRAIRYRRGRTSPVGFWLDSYNYERLIADVLDPLGPTGDNRYRPAAHDLSTDAILDPDWRTAPPGSVIVIDGLFLHRDELADRWHFSVFLDVPFEVTATRMAARDGTSPDPHDPGMRRYVDAQRIYDSECAPRARATVVIDNADLNTPTFRVQATDQPDPCDLTIENYAAEIDTYLARSSQLPQEVRRYLDDFAALVPGGHVLELGSGPGWDADYLEAQGVLVSRTDATAAFVERLRDAGNDARVLDARDDDFGGPFDGVLADAVLLHLSRQQAEDAFGRARRAVVAGGVLAVTLKEGDGSEWTTAKLGRPRWFTYWRAADLTQALNRAGWHVLSLRHVQGRHEPWLFVVARTARSS